MRYSAISAPVWDHDNQIATLLIPEEFDKMSHGLLDIADFVSEHLRNSILRTLHQSKVDYTSNVHIVNTILYIQTKNAVPQ